MIDQQKISTDDVIASDDILKKDTMTMETYKLLRAYIDEENKLLNYRMTWLLTINGFLFASYAISLQKKIEFQSDGVISNISLQLLAHSLKIEKFTFFLCVLCTLGILICFNSLSGIRGARRAVNYLENYVDTMYVVRVIPLSSKDPVCEASIDLTASTRKIFAGKSMYFMRRFIEILRPHTREEKYINLPSFVCLNVENNGLLPFITGGGFYTKSRSTKMTSLMLSKFMLSAWVMLLFFAIVDKMAG